MTAASFLFAAQMFDRQPRAGAAGDGRNINKTIHKSQSDDYAAAN